MLLRISLRTALVNSREVLNIPNLYFSYTHNFTPFKVSSSRIKSEDK